MASDTRAILVELGRRRMVGGQEDMIVNVALDLAAAPRAASLRRDALRAVDGRSAWGNIALEKHHLVPGASFMPDDLALA